MSVFDKQKSRRSFDRAAIRYDEHARLQQKVASTLIEHLEAHIKNMQPQSILDLGCGTGQITEAICQQYLAADVVSLDFSQNMLAQTERRLSSSGLSTSAICADAEQLPFQEGAFDLIISSLMLQWSNDLRNTLTKIHDSLAEQGILAFSSLSNGSLKEVKSSWKTVDGGVHSSDFLTLQTFESIAKKSGFSKVTVVPETIVMCYPNVREMLLEMKGIGASNARSERNKGLTGRQRFDAFERAFEAYRLPDGAYPCTWEVTYVFCSK